MKFAPLALVLILVGICIAFAVYDHTWVPLLLAVAILSIGGIMGVYTPKRPGGWQ
jgi:hypothetical protein